MNSHRSWSDFDQTWKSVEILKEELQKTEKKLQNTTIPSFLKSQPNELFSAVPNEADCDNYLSERRWRKRKIYSRLKGSHLLTGQSLDTPVFLPSTSVEPWPYVPEDQPKSGYKLPLNKTSVIEKSKYLTTGFLSEYIEASSFESSASNSDILSIQSASETTLKNSPKPKTIHFSSWEKEYLRKEVPEVDVPESSLASSSQTFVKRSVPFSVSYIELQKRRTPRLEHRINQLKENDDDFLKLKKIIDQQRERNNRLISEVHVEPFVSVAPPVKTQVPKDDKVVAVVKTDASTSTTYLSSPEEAEAPIPFVRKTTVIPPPPVYKGFSLVQSLLSPTKQNEIKIISPSKHKGDAPHVKSATTVVKRLYDTPTKPKQNSAPCTWKRSGKYDVPPCIILNGRKSDLFQPVTASREQKDETERKDSAVQTTEEKQRPIKNAVSSSSETEGNNLDSSSHETIDMTSDSEDITLQVVCNLKNDDKENDIPSSDENLIAVRKMLEQIMDDNDTESEKEDAVEEEKSKKKIKKSTFTSPPAKKRKTITHPEQKQPTPKIRHYNREKVREFMMKQKILRQKHLREEQQKHFQAEQMKKKRLEQVYEQQKMVAKSFVKPRVSQPLKVLQENIAKEPDATCNLKKKSTTKKPSIQPTRGRNIVAFRTISNPKFTATRNKKLVDEDTMLIPSFVKARNDDIISQVSRTIISSSSQSEFKSQEKFSTITEEIESDGMYSSKTFDSSMSKFPLQAPSTSIDVELPNVSEGTRSKSTDNEEGLTIFSEDSISTVKLTKTDNLASTHHSEKTSTKADNHMKKDSKLIPFIKSLDVPLSPDSSTESIAVEKASTAADKIPSANPKKPFVARKEPAVQEESIVHNKPPVAQKESAGSSGSQKESAVIWDGSSYSQKESSDSKKESSDSQKESSDSKKESSDSQKESAVIRNGSAYSQKVSSDSKKESSDSKKEHPDSKKEHPIVEKEPFNYQKEPPIIQKEPFYSQKEPPIVQKVPPAVEEGPLAQGDSLVEEGPLEDFPDTIPKHDESRGENTDSVNEYHSFQNTTLESKADDITKSPYVDKPFANINEGPKWDFNACCLPGSDPYNFINAWNRKPLVFTSPVPQEQKAASEIPSSNASIIVTSTDHKTYSSTFSESTNENRTNEHSEVEGEDQKSDSHINTVINPDEDRKYASHDSSTTLPSVISTDSQSFVSQLSEDVLDVVITPEEVDGDDPTSSTLKENLSRSMEQDANQNGESTESHKHTELSSTFSHDSHRHHLPSSNHRKSSSSSVQRNLERGQKTSDEDSSESVVEHIEKNTSLESVKRSISSSRSKFTHSSRTRSKKSVKSGSKSSTSVNKNSSNIGFIASKADNAGTISEAFKTLSYPAASKGQITNVQTNSNYNNLPMVVPLHQSLIDSQSITKVAVEAASAAATSAVIAALEYQKLLPSKKKLLRMIEKRISSPDNDYSSEFEKSGDSNSTLASSRPSIILDKKKLKSVASSTSGRSIVEEIQHSPASENSNRSHSLSHSVVKSVTSAKYLSSVSEDIISIGEKKRKQSENLSSPSPASLSESESLKSSSLSTTESHVSSHESDHGDPFSQLTMDMVKQMSREEERRARQQLMILECQERTLVEKARSELKWLELLKKKLQEKKAHDKLPVVAKRQQELLLRLRQERAQLRCLQETYRSVSKSRQLLLTEKRKLLTEPVMSTPANAVSEMKGREDFLALFDMQSEIGSPSHSASVCSLHSGASRDPGLEEVKSTTDVSEVIATASSVATTIESQLSSASKSVHESYGKSSKSPSSASRSSKMTETAPSQTSHSTQSLLQGMKKIETNKRYLVKKEQRLQQRRSTAENLMQWQKDLDMEEKKVKGLEKEAIEKIEKSKIKSKYFVSSSTPTSSKNDADFVSSHRTSQETSSAECILSKHSSKGWSISEEVQSGFASSDTQDVSDAVVTASDGIKDLGSSSSDTKSVKHSSSITEEAIAHEESASSVAEEIDAAKASPRNSSANVDSYSDTFNSSSTTPECNLPSREMAPLKKRLNSTARSLFASPRHRRQDSSGSDDSLTISHSETASDQSDIEGRIYALTEEVNRRKAVADKLRSKHQKKQSDCLKKREISLKKQLEAYDKYINEASMELEQQIEAATSPEATSQTVKPQIKQPRVAKTRQLQKQSQALSESPASVSEAEAGDGLAATKEASVLMKERKVQSSLAKKLQVLETKEVPDDISNASSSITLRTNGFSAASLEPNQPKSRHSSEEIHSQSGSSESSLSYSSDFFMASSKEDSFRSRTESFHSNKSDSVEEDIDHPPEESLESFSEDSEAVKTVKRSHSVTTEDGFESSSTIEEEKCSGSNGCSPRRTVDIAATNYQESNRVIKKRSNLVEDITEDIMKSLCEESVAHVLTLLCKSEIKKAQQPKVSHSLMDVHNDIAAKLCEDILNILLEDSILSTLRILTDNKKSKPRYIEDKSVNLPMGDHQSVTKSDDECLQTSGIFNCEANPQYQKPFNVTSHQDWFNDSVYSPPNQSALPPLDQQQLMVHHYPYFYRQIPNKPPPPYTPPSSSSTTTTKDNESITVDPIKEIYSNIDNEIKNCLTTIMEGKMSGLSMDCINAPAISEDISAPSLRHQSIFRTFLFDLTKEMVKKLFTDDENSSKAYKPWLRNQKLTSTPVMPLDKTQVFTKVVSEVKNILKIDKTKDDTSILSAMKLGRKKRDFVDTIIIGELKDEEPDWVNYDEDEFQVKLQLTDSIFSMLLDNTFKHMFSIVTKRQQSCR